MAHEGVSVEERTGPVFNPITRIKRAERMLAFTVSKLVADIGEKAGMVVRDKETSTTRRESGNTAMRLPKP